MKGLIVFSMLISTHAHAELAYDHCSSADAQVKITKGRSALGTLILSDSAGQKVFPLQVLSLVEIRSTFVNGYQAGDYDYCADHLVSYKISHTGALINGAKSIRVNLLCQACRKAYSY
ncbi:MAG TPA: hypothetical protein VNJ01_18345 [Bacteriovoracaceae bacterium]|nr:hypothetical protein [Bacteriovoracaceae bacterium]